MFQGGIQSMFNKGKINTVRTFALGLVFGGIIVTYGSFLVESSIAMAFFMILGLLMVLLSTVVYFWIGFLSTKAVYVTCPNCGKTTKMLGKMDECMYCKQQLTLDRDLATDKAGADEIKEQK
jgi:xanthosine utilization system XapX-like protein